MSYNGRLNLLQRIFYFCCFIEMERLVWSKTTHNIFHVAQHLHPPPRPGQTLHDWVSSHGWLRHHAEMGVFRPVSTCWTLIELTSKISLLLWQASRWIHSLSPASSCLSVQNPSPFSPCFPAISLFPPPTSGGGERAGVSPCSAPRGSWLDDDL